MNRDEKKNRKENTKPQNPTNYVPKNNIEINE